MQDCFRKYPEIYGAELGDDEEDDGTPAAVNPDDDTTPSVQEIDRASEVPFSGVQADTSSVKKDTPVTEAAKTEATKAELKEPETTKTEARDETLRKREPSEKGETSTDS